MPQFKTASRSFSDLDAAYAELDEIFSIVKDKAHKASAMKKLDAERYAIAELIISLISDSYTLTDPSAFFVEPLDGDIRNDYIWRELDSNLRVVPRSYGTKPLSQRLTFKEYSISTSHREIAVEIPLEEIAAGSTTASQVTQAITSALRRDKIARMFDGIDAGVTAGADRTGVSGYTLRYSGFTQGNLDAAIDGLQDEGDSPAIFARHIAMAPAIRNFTGWSDDVTEELNRRGVIGQYHGANVVTLRDGFSKVDNAHVIRKDRIYMASGRKGAYWMEKDVNFLNWSMIDPRTSTFGVGTRIEDGMLVWDANYYRIIEV